VEKTFFSRSSGLTPAFVWPGWRGKAGWGCRASAAWRSVGFPKNIDIPLRLIWSTQRPFLPFCCGDMAGISHADFVPWAVFAVLWAVIGQNIPRKSDISCQKRLFAAFRGKGVPDKALMLSLFFFLAVCLFAFGRSETTQPRGMKNPVSGVAGGCAAAVTAAAARRRFIVLPTFCTARTGPTWPDKTCLRTGRGKKNSVFLSSTPALHYLCSLV